MGKSKKFEIFSISFILDPPDSYRQWLLMILFTSAPCSFTCFMSLGTLERKSLQEDVALQILEMSVEMVQ